MTYRSRGKSIDWYAVNIICMCEYNEMNETEEKRIQIHWRDVWEMRRKYWCIQKFYFSLFQSGLNKWRILYFVRRMNAARKIFWSRWKRSAWKLTIHEKSSRWQNGWQSHSENQQRSWIELVFSTNRTDRTVPTDILRSNSKIFLSIENFVETFLVWFDKFQDIGNSSYQGKA